MGFLSMRGNGKPQLVIFHNFDVEKRTITNGATRAYTKLIYLNTDVK